MFVLRILPLHDEWQLQLYLSLFARADARAARFAGRDLFPGAIRQDGAAARYCRCGLCVGLAFLTKPEAFLAVFPATAAAFRWRFTPSQHHRLESRPYLRLMAAPAFISALVAVALLSLAMPLSDAVLGTWGANRWLFAQQITNLPFYLHSMGVYDPAETGKLLLQMIGLYAVFFGLAAGTSLVKWRTRASELTAMTACFVAAAATTMYFFDDIPGVDLFRPLPFVLVAVLATMLVMFFRRPERAYLVGFVLPLTFLLFALLFMAKIFFFARVLH